MWTESRPVLARFSYVWGVTDLLAGVDALFHEGPVTIVNLVDSNVRSISSSLGGVCSSAGSVSVHCSCSASSEYQQALKSATVGEAIPVTLSITYRPTDALPFRTKEASMTLPGPASPPTMQPSNRPCGSCSDMLLSMSDPWLVEIKIYGCVTVYYGYSIDWDPPGTPPCLLCYRDTFCNNKYPIDYDHVVTSESKMSYDEAVATCDTSTSDLCCYICSLAKYYSCGMNPKYIYLYTCIYIYVCLCCL